MSGSSADNSATIFSSSFGSGQGEHSGNDVKLSDQQWAWTQSGWVQTIQYHWQAVVNRKLSRGPTWPFADQMFSKSVWLGYQIAASLKSSYWQLPGVTGVKTEKSIQRINKSMQRNHSLNFMSPGWKNKEAQGRDWKGFKLSRGDIILLTRAKQQGNLMVI